MVRPALDGRIGKVAAIVLREGRAGTEVLVFDHPLEDGGVSVQLPAGTIEPGEVPDAAVVRELVEETGVNGALVALVGVRDEESDSEKRRRWIYVLRATDAVPSEWGYKCDCGAPTVCHWLPLEHAEIDVVQQAWLDAAKSWIRTSLSSTA